MKPFVQRLRECSEEQLEEMIALNKSSIFSLHQEIETITAVLETKRTNPTKGKE